MTLPSGFFYKSIPIMVAAAAGIGICFIVVKCREKIWKQFNNIISYNDPFRNKQIKVVSTEEECQTLMQRLKQDCADFNILGFACEWVRAGRYRRPVALLQLTSYRGLSALVRLSQMPTIPPDLTEILQDNNILKVGVATNSDANYLQQDHGILVSSTFDLRYMATKAGCQPLNLADMASEYLNVKLDEDGRIINSDWESPILNEKQIEYAANNSYVAIELFKYFADRLKPKGFFEKQSHYINGIVNNYCLRYFNFNFNEAQNSKKVNFNGVTETRIIPSCKTSFNVMKCVVCGQLNTHHLKSIVPLEYIEYFPRDMKESHDIVSLCMPCYEISKLHDLELREKLVAQCDAPTGLITNDTKTIEMPHLKELKSICREMYTQNLKLGQIHESRKNELITRLKELCPDQDNFTKEFFEANIDIDVFETIEVQNTHEAKVVEFYKNSEDGLMGLERLWYEHFVQTMNPNYMSDFQLTGDEK